jgi:ketosteroid isomerase-like protein
MQAIFAALATGDTRAFREAIAEDMTWTLIGTTRWSRTYTGRATILADLTRPLFARFAGPYRATVHRFIAEDDLVVVEFRGDVTTTEGKPYSNTYCYVCRLAGGQIRELTEYCDTALIDAVL